MLKKSAILVALLLALTVVFIGCPEPKYIESEGATGWEHDLGEFELQLEDNFQYGKGYQGNMSIHTDPASKGAELFKGKRVSKDDEFKLEIEFEVSRSWDEAIDGDMRIGLVDRTPAASYWGPLSWVPNTDNPVTIPAIMLQQGAKIQQTLYFKALANASSSELNANDMSFEFDAAKRGSEGVGGSGKAHEVTLTFSKFVFSKIVDETATPPDPWPLFRAQVALETADLTGNTITKGAVPAKLDTEPNLLSRKAGTTASTFSWTIPASMRPLEKDDIITVEFLSIVEAGDGKLALVTSAGAAIKDGDNAIEIDLAKNGGRAVMEIPASALASFTSVDKLYFKDESSAAAEWYLRLNKGTVYTDNRANFAIKVNGETLGNAAFATSTAAGSPQGDIPFTGAALVTAIEAASATVKQPGKYELSFSGADYRGIPYGPSATGPTNRGDYSVVITFDSVEYVASFKIEGATAAAADFDFGKLLQGHLNKTDVTITPQAGKSNGIISNIQYREKDTTGGWIAMAATTTGLVYDIQFNIAASSDGNWKVGSVSTVGTDTGVEIGFEFNLGNVTNATPWENNDKSNWVFAAADFSSATAPAGKVFSRVTLAMDLHNDTPAAAANIFTTDAWSGMTKYVRNADTNRLVRQDDIDNSGGKLTASDLHQPLLDGDDYDGDPVPVGEEWGFSEVVAQYNAFREDQRRTAFTKAQSDVIKGLFVNWNNPAPADLKHIVLKSIILHEAVDE
jgi:hypothetical protein